MTEHVKIPASEKNPGDGDSLLERASGAFGLQGFRPAPVPGDLAAEPARISRRKSQAAVESTEPETTTSNHVRPVKLGGLVHPVDNARLRETGMIAPDGAVTTLLEEFRIVKRQILRGCEDARSKGDGERAKRVLVASPLPGEGKSFCAVNLALALAAERDVDVLLVDADFAKPSVLAMLGLPEGKGLMDAISDPAVRIEDCVLATDVPGLWVLPAGNRTSADSEFLASARTGEILDRLTLGAPNRIVIFDSPPALAATISAELAKHVGQVVMVIRADRTGQSSLEDALHLLSVCPDIKLLLNDARFSPSGRRFGDYHGYGGDAG